MISGENQLSKKRGCCHSRQYGAQEFTQGLQSLFPEFCSSVKTIHFLEGCQQACFLQKVFPGNESKARMTGERICLPFFNHRWAGADFDLVQQAVNKSGMFSKCQIAVVGPPRLQLSEIVSNNTTRQ